MGKFGERRSSHDLINAPLERIILCIPQWRRGGDAENGAPVTISRGEAWDSVGETTSRFSYRISAGEE